MQEVQNSVVSDVVQYGRWSSNHILLLRLLRVDIFLDWMDPEIAEIYRLDGILCYKTYIILVELYVHDRILKCFTYLWEDRMEWTHDIMMHT